MADLLASDWRFWLRQGGLGPCPVCGVKHCLVEHYSDAEPVPVAARLQDHESRLSRLETHIGALGGAQERLVLGVVERELVAIAKQRADIVEWTDLQEHVNAALAAIATLRDKA